MTEAGTVRVAITVDTTELDQAIEKLERLIDLARRAEIYVARTAERIPSEDEEGA